MNINQVLAHLKRRVNQIKPQEIFYWSQQDKAALLVLISWADQIQTDVQNLTTRLDRIDPNKIPESTPDLAEAGKD